MSQTAPKKAKYSQKYQERGCLRLLYVLSQRFPYSGYWSIAIASSGKFDVSRHKSGPSHVSCEKKTKENVVIKNFLALITIIVDCLLQN